ncbi:WD repeat-containing WRAP73 [Olea europaea subsp. europaea]|uniref:WD repeat-containing WRAP73 n=1 Tax=Olea europaea subsp. europaea TaxID=158383 RepID=A0A8S0SZN3_OLEEU|nr:WD repeat-containing WRAP73 [Olea europaea subsp. europaea]
MEFTEAYKQAGPCAFSPNARFLAVAVDYRLVIRDVLTFKVVQLFSCLDKITYIEWALDSEYILCGLYKRPMIQAWSLAQPEWTCKIDEGSAGISYARWSPDSRHILTTSDFQLRLTVWSLLNTACIHVQGPKHGSKGVSFTKDGKFSAICTRRDCKDYVNLLSCHTWEIMGVFAVDTLDLADIQWSPDDSAIVIWDSPLEYKVLIYSPDGRCLSKYQAYECGLGVKSVSWSPCSQFLAVGSYDQMIRVLNHLTWKVFAEFTHLSTVRGPCGAAIFKEVDEPLQLDMSELSLNDDFAQRRADSVSETQIQVRYDVMEVPITLPSLKPPADKPNPKQGIGLMSWSSDSQYICTRNDNMPTVLWIWEVHHLELAAILIQKDPIRAVAWDPKYPRLLLCTGSNHSYMWTPSGAYCINIPFPQFSVIDLKWNLDGSCLLLKDKELFCCAALPMLQESSDYSSDD